MLETDYQHFMKQTGDLLVNLSAQADRFEAFRRLTFFSILFAFPVILFLLFHSVLMRIAVIFLPANISIAVAALGCIVLGLGPLGAVYKARTVKIDPADLSRMLASERWQDRTMALRTIDRERINISKYPHFSQILASPHLPERYWLARALGANRSPETYNALLELLRDPNPNVMCQAFYGLGRRGDKQAIPIILDTIKKDESWYSQRYGYLALRRLGWVQPGNR